MILHSLCKKVLKRKSIGTTLFTILKERKSKKQRMSSNVYLIFFPLFLRSLLAAPSLSLSALQATLSGSKCPFGTVSLATLSAVLLSGHLSSYCLPCQLLSFQLCLCLSLLFSALLFYSVCNVLFTSVLKAELTKLSSSLSGDSCHCPHAADIHLQLSSTWPETGDRRWETGVGDKELPPPI